MNTEPDPALEALVANDPWIDRLHHFAGRWGVPSVCGLRTLLTPGGITVVATELYDRNPGSSVTAMAGELVRDLATEHGVAPERTTLVVRCPGRGSKLSCYDETFDRFEPGAKGAGRWARMTAAEVEAQLR